MSKLHTQNLAGLTRPAIGAGIIESGVPATTVQSRHAAGVPSLAPRPARGRLDVPCRAGLIKSALGEMPHG